MDINTAGSKVTRAITGATTVNPGCWAAVSYFPAPMNAGTTNPPPMPISTIIFGPGQQIPLVFSYNCFTNGGNYQFNLNMLSGVEYGG